MAKHLSPRRAKEIAVIGAILSAIWGARYFLAPYYQAWVMSLPPSQQKLPFVVMAMALPFVAFLAILHYGKD
jgi:hypothetical protein